MLGKIFGAKRDEITGEWRKLHNAELHAFVFIYLKCGKVKMSGSNRYKQHWRGK